MILNKASFGMILQTKRTLAIHMVIAGNVKHSARLIEQNICLVGTSINKGCAVFFYSVVMHGLRISRYLQTRCRVKGGFTDVSNTQNFVKIRARDLAVLICTSSLLSSILHCIKSQQVFAKQKRKSLVSCGLDGRYFGNKKI